jgi:hypothetical protein
MEDATPAEMEAAWEWFDSPPSGQAKADLKALAG